MKSLNNFLSETRVNEDKFDLINKDIKILGTCVNWLEDNPHLKTNFIGYAKDVDVDDLNDFIETWDTEFHGNSD